MRRRIGLSLRRLARWIDPFQGEATGANGAVTGDGTGRTLPPFDAREKVDGLPLVRPCGCGPRDICPHREAARG